MKTTTIFLLTLFLFSCNADTKNILLKKEEAKNYAEKIKYPCLVAEKVTTIKVKDHKSRANYYTVLYGGGDQAFDSLRLIVSEFDITKDLKVDKNIDYSSEVDQKKLVRCLQEYNENSLVQDLWLDMKKSLDEEDNTRWVTDKNGNNHPEKGFYPNSIGIENPNIDTFKVDNMGAEIKSLVFSNHSETQVTTIKWKFKDGNYIFDNYTTSIRKED